MKARSLGFTLIELLVVIAIIAILAAILFPVFAQAREKARSISCLNDMKQLAVAEDLYADSYNEALHEMIPGGWYGNAGQVGEPSMWMVQLQPFIKSKDVFRCPSATAPLGDLTYAQRDKCHIGRNSFLGFYFNYYYYYIWANLNPQPPNPRPIRLAMVAYPTQTVSFADGFDRTAPDGTTPRPYWLDPGYGYGVRFGLSDRHQHGVNIALLDGHAQHYAIVSVLNQMAIDTGDNSYVIMTNYNKARLIWDIDAPNPYTQPNLYPDTCCR